MKIRSGFVSNSSSSSFVIIAPTEAVDEVMPTLSEAHKQVVNHLGYKKSRLFGKDVSIFSGMSGNYDSFEDFELDMEVENIDEDFSPYDYWNEFLDKVKEAAGKDNFFTHETDC